MEIFFIPHHIGALYRMKRIHAEEQSRSSRSSILGIPPPILLFCSSCNEQLRKRIPSPPSARCCSPHSFGRVYLKFSPLPSLVELCSTRSHSRTAWPWFLFRLSSSWELLEIPTSIWAKRGGRGYYVSAFEAGYR